MVQIHLGPPSVAGRPAVLLVPPALEDILDLAGDCPSGVVSVPPGHQVSVVASVTVSYMCSNRELDGFR